MSLPDFRELFVRQTGKCELASLRRVQTNRDTDWSRLPVPTLAVDRGDGEDVVFPGAARKESTDEGFTIICPHAWSPGPRSAAPNVLDDGCGLPRTVSRNACLGWRTRGGARRAAERDAETVLACRWPGRGGHAAAVYLGAGQAGQHVCAADLQVCGVRRAGHAHVRRFTAIGVRSSAALAGGEVVLALRRDDGPRHGLWSAAAVYGSGKRPPVSVSELGRSRPACAACSDRDCSFRASGWSRSAAGPAAS